MKKVLFLLLLIAIFIRSTHFTEHLNFSTDQASHAARSLEIFRNKELTLLGPSISFKHIGREVFTSSIFYYFQLLFLLPAGFDPIVASYLYMLFSALMIIPLYIGTKKLVSEKGAVLISILYALLPFYIDFSRFLWNPNFQFSLTPLLILLLGLNNIFLVGLMAGILLLFHYQYFLIIIGLVIYLLYKKIRLKNFILGLMLGFSPMIIFEIRHQFYNIQTLVLYLQNFHKVFAKGVGSFNLHYFLSPSLFIFLIFIGFVKKQIKNFHLIFTWCFLLLLALSLYSHKPSRGFGMTKDWNFLQEQKVYKIIRGENLTNYNIANLAYDTVSSVQKYLHKKDGIKMNYDDYYRNKYLFVISDSSNFMNNPAYEVNTFKPSRRLKKWRINNTYTLYLLKR